MAKIFGNWVSQLFPKFLEKIIFGGMESLLVPSQLIKVIDHTYLKTEAEGDSSQVQEKMVRQLAWEAHEAGAFGVCVRENQVKLAKSILQGWGSSLKVISVVGFPCGDDFSTQQKLELLSQVIENGADEIDIVFNYKAFLKGHLDQVHGDILALSTKANNHVLKVIFENACLPQERKLEAYNLVKNAFQESSAPPLRRFFKTSTGFAKVIGKPIGATLEDVLLMKKVAGMEIGIKPSGGISDLNGAKEYFYALGSPWNDTRSEIDPYKFRIGSSSLLTKLRGSNSPSAQPSSSY